MVEEHSDMLGGIMGIGYIVHRDNTLCEIMGY